jgi:hypothetical protein
MSNHRIEIDGADARDRGWTVGAMARERVTKAQ